MNIIQIFVYMLLLSVGSFGGYFFVMFLKKPKKQVLFLRRRDYRGKILPVIEETDIALTTKKMGGVQHHIHKSGPGWTFNQGGRMVTKYLALEGKAFTAVGDDPGSEKLSVYNYLKFIWGDKFDQVYPSLPDDMRRAVETDVIGITIEVAEGVGPKEAQIPGVAIGLDTKRRLVEDIMKTSRGRDSVTPRTIIQQLLPYLVGAMTMYFIVAQGYI